MHVCVFLNIILDNGIVLCWFLKVFFSFKYTKLQLQLL